MASELMGVAALTAQLNELGAKVAGRELRGTARASAAIAMEKAEANIPKGSVPHKTYKGRLVAPGFASRNLRIVTRINKYTGSVEAIIGPRREAFYATQFLEVGTSKMAAKPWLRPAFESSVDPMLRTIKDQLVKRLGRIKKRAST